MIDVDVCNLALANLGISQRISSINPPDQGLPQATTLAAFYAITRDEALRSAPWNFATKAIPLTLISDPTTITYPGWGYVYQYPNDCLWLGQVMTQWGIRNSYSWSWTSWSYPNGPTYASTKIPFKVALSADGSQKVVMCDIPNAYAQYISRVTNPDLWTPDFTNHVGWRLAARSGGPLSANPARVQTAESMSEKSWGEAVGKTSASWALNW